MAESDWSKERDDEVPVSRDRVDSPATADQSVVAFDTGGLEEPDHGVTSWLTWIKLGAETVLAIVTIASVVYGMLHGNGG
ncbi:hypothetical protein ACIBCU_37860 [Streptomyces sp. NPDC051064]|uniref:hypothetical protein n=1 Tax=Streptomyces sp. NPDC051064 TaxID=3365641 RepID=UPI0037BBAFBD